MKYLKLFTNHSEYEDFVDDGTMLRPNVSHCVQEEEVHYNPLSDPRLVIKYNATDASVPTKLYEYYDGETTAALLFNNVVIDDTEASIANLDSASGQTQLSVGEHTVKYTLKDPTFIGLIADQDSQSLKNGAMFWNCADIVSVEIPNTVTTIGEYTFQGCSSLTSITIPNTVTMIGLSTFQGCTSLPVENNIRYADDIYAVEAADKTLQSYNIKQGTRFIGGYAFQNCSNLTSITIPNTVTIIGDYAFQNCSGLTSVAIPDRVTYIGGNTFYGCSGLTSVTIGNSVTSIGNAAFQNCSSLTSVTIPNSVTSIGNNVFFQCSSLKSVTIGNGIKNLSFNAFAYCSSLTSVTIPNSVTIIDGGAFMSCSSLSSITIPNSVTSIGNNAFYNCSGLTSVTIPSSVTSIGNYTLQNCYSLTSVTIGSGVTSIGQFAFNYCTNLTSITSLAITAPTIESSTFNGVKTNGTLTVPSGSSGYDVWMGSGNYYLGSYNWTKVEQ